MGPRACRVAGLGRAAAGSALLLGQLVASGQSLHDGWLLYVTGEVTHPSVVDTGVHLLLLAVAATALTWGLLLVGYGSWRLEPPRSAR